jgi:hypothetical protein
MLKSRISATAEGVFQEYVEVKWFKSRTRY